MLKPNGTLLMSVPAHASKWTHADTWADHYRRYEKTELCQLLEKAGFRILMVENWGFPLSNMLLAWRSRLHKRQLDTRGTINNRSANNESSGIDRAGTSSLYPLLAIVPGRVAMRCAFFLQRLARRKDWGIGDLVLASRVETGEAYEA